jgi:phenylalanyl-tRNA synthetase alpha subunit
MSGAPMQNLPIKSPGQGHGTLDQLVQQAAFAARPTARQLEQIKARYLGKSGADHRAAQGAGKLEPEARKAAGAAINAAKEAIEAALEARRERPARSRALEARSPRRSTSPCPGAAKRAAACTR